MSQKSGAKQQKTTAKQKEARIQAAREREERADRIKRIVTVVVCIILVLALFIPTMALSVLSGS